MWETQPYEFEERVFPKKFTNPQGLMPGDLFPYSYQYERFENRYNNRNLLIYTDGACLNNGYSNAAAGWAFVFKQGSGGAVGRYYSTLPHSEQNRETSNRAELRAVLDALEHMDWRAGHYMKLTIATDSQYVMDGATSWARSWVRNGWERSDGQPVKNQDLWYKLLVAIECLYDDGLAVDFWWIPREYNTEADRKAKQSAELAARYR